RAHGWQHCTRAIPAQSSAAARVCFAHVARRGSWHRGPSQRHHQSRFRATSPSRGPQIFPPAASPALRRTLRPSGLISVLGMQEIFRGGAVSTVVLNRRGRRDSREPFLRAPLRPLRLNPDTVDTALACNPQNPLLHPALCFAIFSLAASPRPV